MGNHRQNFRKAECCGNCVYYERRGYTGKQGSCDILELAIWGECNVCNKFTRNPTGSGNVQMNTEKLEAGISRNGSYSRKQLQLLGEKWPLVKDWEDRIVTRIIPKAAYDKFLLLKDKHLDKSNRKLRP